MKVFDGHCDIFSHVDVRRAEGKTDVFSTYHKADFGEGSICGGIFAVFVSPDGTREDVEARALRQLKHAAQELHDCSGIVRVIKTAEDFCYAEREGKTAAVIGLEGLDYLGGDPDLLYLLHAFGARCAMLSWNRDNLFGGGAKSGTGKGITPEGRRAVRILDRLRMVVDVSHSNEQTFWGVLEEARAPVLASHNNALAITQSKKNLTDAQLDAIAQTGGVVCYNALRAHTAADPLTAGIDDAVRHIDYMAERMGIDHVGFGFDFLNYFDAPEEKKRSRELPGLRGARDVQNLVNALRTSGYTEQDLEKITHTNMISLIARVIG